jgi:hypothetical protein
MSSKHSEYVPGSGAKDGEAPYKKENPMTSGGSGEKEKNYTDENPVK